MISAMLTAQGYKTGLYTSPHISSVRERFRIDGKPIPDSDVGALVYELQPYFDRVQPSFFEGMTALGFLYFKREKVDVLVAEVGLGGRLDATNVVNPVVSVITSVGLDHTSSLGDNLTSIAGEKAGIIKPGVPAVVGFNTEGISAIVEHAATVGSDLHIVPEETEHTVLDHGLSGTTFDLSTPEDIYRSLRIPLPGNHQIQNASTAIRALEVAGERFPVSAYSIRNGLLNVHGLAGLRARLEVVRHEPAIILDVAHNPQGIHAALQHVRSEMPGAPVFVALGIMADKDLPAVMQSIADSGATLIPIELSSERAAKVHDLASLAASNNVEVMLVDTLEEAVRYVRQKDTESVLLITGSHQTVEQAFEKEVWDTISA